MTPLLVLDHLTYYYPQTSCGITDLSLTLPPGKKTALVGANGSGKSTLLLLAAGCLHPASGRVLLAGDDCTGKPQTVRDHAGVLFQDPDYQLFMPSVRAEVLFSLSNLENALPADAADRVATMLDSLNIAHLATRPPHRLSVGEKKRVALASLLITRPRLLLLDEPSAGLDPRSRRTLIRLLQDMDLAMLTATHDLDLVMDIAEEVIFLKEGKIAGQSEIPGLLADAGFLEEQGLELPLRLTPQTGGRP